MFKRLLAGSTLSIISMFANIAVAMAMMPFIIHSLGDHDYGLWILVASFVGYYGLLDFGMSTAATRFISRADGRGDVEGMNVILNTAGIFFAVLGLTVFAISLIVAVSVNNTTTAILWLTVGITCIFQFGLRGFYGLFFARIRQDIMSYTNLAKLTLRTALILYYLHLGYGVIAVAMITMVSEIVFYMVDMYILRKIVPEMRFSWDLIQKDKVKEMFHYGKFSMVVQISDLLKLRALPVIVTYTVGIPFIVFFSIAIRLVEIFHQIIEKIIHMLTPVFSQFEGRGETHNISKVFWMSFRINLILSFIIGGGIIIFSGNFISWWIGEDYALAHTLTLWLSVAFIALTMNETGKTVLLGVSKHQKFAWVSLIESIIAAGAGMIFGYLYGPAWIAIGMAIVMLVVELFWKPLVISREINIDLKRYYATMLEVVLIVGTPIIIWAWFLKDWNNASIWDIMILSVAFMLTLVPSMWFGLGQDSKGVIRRKFFAKMSGTALNV